MKHIHNRFLVWLLLLSVVPALFIGTFSYWRSARTVQDKINRSSQTLVQQITSRLDEEVDRINKYLDILFANDKIQKMMSEVDFVRPTGETYLAYNELDPMIRSLLYNDESVRTIMLFPVSGGCYFYKGYISDRTDIRQTPMFQSFEQADGKIVWHGLIDNPDLLSQGEPVYAVGRLIKDTAFRGNIDAIGVIIILLDPRIFSDVYRTVDIGLNNQIAIYDHNSQLISASQTEAAAWPDTYSFSQGGQPVGSYRHQDLDDAMITYARSPLSQWLVVSKTPYQYYVSEIRLIGQVTVIVTLIILAAIMLVSLIVSRRISAPICQLAGAMKQVGQKNFDVSVPIRSNDEIGLISEGFNQMVVNIKHLFQLVIHEERQKRNAQVRALQYQINPHFLYNTLGSIRMVATMHQDKDVADMILVLNRLLRNTIRKGGQMIPVAEEITNLKDFFALTQVRYKNRLVITYDLGPEIRNYQMPGMLLQPIAENAILHGLSDKLNEDDTPDVAVIRITGRIQEGRLALVISDNGKGMTQTEMTQILRRNHGADIRSDMHIGVKNTDDRIKLEFGPEYGLTINSEPGHFTAVCLELPLIRNEEQRDDHDLAG